MYCPFCLCQALRGAWSINSFLANGYHVHSRLLLSLSLLLLHVKTQERRGALSSQVSIVLLLESVKCIEVGASDWHQPKEKRQDGAQRAAKERGVGLLPSSIVAVPSHMMVGCPSSFLRSEAEKTASHQDRGVTGPRDEWQTEEIKLPRQSAQCLWSWTCSPPEAGVRGREGCSLCKTNKQKHPDRT